MSANYGSTLYPVALDTLDNLIRARSGAIGLLDAPGIDAVVTSIPMPSTSNLSSSGVVTIEGEDIAYSSKDATHLLGCTRGMFTGLGASAPAPHAAGAAVEQLIIAATHDVQNDAIIALETKLGIGADAPALNEFMVGTGAGSSGWSALTSGHVTTALGFIPLSAAGGTLSGALGIDDGAGDVAASGSLRLRNQGSISARNAAGLADLDLVKADASDRISLYGGAATLTAAGLLTGTTLTGSSAVTSGGSISAATFVSAGSNPAASGGVRLANDTWIRARNAANGADVDMAKINAAGSLVLGPGSGIAVDGSGVVTLASDLALTEGGTGASTAANARTNLGLVIGANVQAFHANLSAFAGLSLIADRLPYADGAGTLALATFTAAGRALIDDADAAAQRTTLGIGSMGTQAASSVAITGGSITGITDLAVADGGTGSSTAANARTALGLVIGTNVQAWDADLDTWAGKTAPSGVVVGTTDTQTLTNKTLTTPIINAATLTGNIDFDDGGTARFFRPDGTTIGLEIDAEATNNYIKAITGALVFMPTSAADLYFDLPASRNVNFRNSALSTFFQVDEDAGGVRFGSSSNPAITDILSASATYDPPSTVVQTASNTTIALTGAAIGDKVICSHSTADPLGFMCSARVQAANLIGVTLLNYSGTTQNPGSGTLSVMLLKHT